MENQKGDLENGGADGALALVMRDLRSPRGGGRWRASTGDTARGRFGSGTPKSGSGKPKGDLENGGADGALAPAMRDLRPQGGGPMAR